MRRRGKIGERKQAECDAAKDAWFQRWGQLVEDDWLHRCQSCGRPLSRKRAEFSHKVPRSLGGDVGCHVQPENGIASCHWCHVWLEQSPLRQDARAFLINCPAHLLNNLLVPWPPHLLRSLKTFLARATLSF